MTYTVEEKGANGAAAPRAEVPAAAVERAYARAMAHARRYGRRRIDREGLLIDAATSAVLWALRHCGDASTFAALCHSAVLRFCGRALTKHRTRVAARPNVLPLCPDDLPASRDGGPVRPEMHPALPASLAFVVRLYYFDQFCMRDIALLTGRSPNTVDLMLKRAARILAPGAAVPPRAKRAKRLCRG